MSRYRNSSHRNGFTLIELLTVMAILISLAAILLPVAWSAKKTALRAECAVNLHHLGTSIQHYATRQRGWFPARDVTNPQEITGTWKSWFNDDSIDPTILYCPAVHQSNRADYAESQWSAAAPITDYEILIGTDNFNDDVTTALNTGKTRVESVNLERVDTTPSMVMIVGDRMYKDSAQTGYDGWVANHVDEAMKGGEGIALGRNVLYSDYRVEWRPRSRSESISYYSSGTATYYHPDLAH